jgi:alcohol dehydrogenase class IV
MKGSSKEQKPLVDTAGLAHLAQHLERLGSRRVLIITGPSRRHLALVERALGSLQREVFDRAIRHVPEEVIAMARDVMARLETDTIVTVGGGATTWLGKVLRL